LGVVLVDVERVRSAIDATLEATSRVGALRQLASAFGLELADPPRAERRVVKLHEKSCWRAERVWVGRLGHRDVGVRMFSAGPEDEWPVRSS
jgi:hypothetical protein